VDKAMTEDQKPDAENELDSISKRLKFIIQDSGIKQSHMAKKLGITKGAVSYILNSDVKSSKNAKRLAKELNVNEKWLLTGEGEIFNQTTQAPKSGLDKSTNGTLEQHLVPVYYLEQLKCLISKQSDSFSQPIGFAISQKVYGNGRFAVYLSHNHYAPKFELGDQILFIPQTNFINNDWIIVYHVEKNEFVFGQGIHTQGSKALLVGSNSPPLEIDLSKDKLLGVYIECIKLANK
jgi:transcriptional regulator with XRE-family HTH domain